MAQVREAAAMKTTIIFAHPWSGSFNRAVLNTVMAAGGNSNLIDLYQDNFNPVMSAPELALYGKGQYIDPLIGRYIAMLKETARAIFIFPIWWYDMPAILRGFFDKVMLSLAQPTMKTSRACTLCSILGAPFCSPPRQRPPGR